MISRAGPNPNRSVTQGLLPSWIGSALISTLLSIKKASNPGSTKAGSVVAKVCAVLGRTRGAAPGSPLGAALGALAGGGGARTPKTALVAPAPLQDALPVVFPAPPLNRGKGAGEG